MKAIVYSKYGSPDELQLREVEKPSPKENEVLIKVHAASVNDWDWGLLRGKPFMVRILNGLFKPKIKILGTDVAGTIEAIGKNVHTFKPGDEVYGSFNPTCAEYACASEAKLELKPANLSMEQAAAVPTSAIAALQGIRDAGKVKPGQKVLINGASGGVGTFAVQIAKAFGAEVTGVCSTRNTSLVRSIGADHVVDYTQEDFTQSGQRYDLILDNVGNHSFSDCRRVLTPQGTLIPNTGHAGLGYIVKALVVSLFVRQQGRPFVAIPSNDDLVFLKELIEAGKLTPVIDRTYPLSETPEAFRYLDKGHARGKVVITV